MARRRKSAISLWVRIALLVPLPAIAIWIFLTGQHPRQGLFESAALSGQTLTAASARPVGLPTYLPVSDFRLVDTIQIYDSDNLYVKIDGHDVAFFRFGFVSLTFASYAGKGNDLFDVYVYRMNRRQNALGIYAAERSDDREDLDVADAGYRSGGAIFLYRGPYYAQIIPAEAGDDISAAMTEMIDSLCARIPAPTSPLPGLNDFPATGRIANSDGYFPDNAFGTDFVGDVYTTQYRVGDIRVTVFQHRSDSANVMFTRYREFLDASATKEGPLSIGGVDVRRYNDYGESLWIWTFDDVFAGMMGQLGIEDGRDMADRVIVSSRGQATE